MMKQEYITKVAEAFRKGKFMPVSGVDHIKADYDEAYIDERTDYDFEHVYVHLMKEEREGDFLEIFSVELQDEFLESQFAAAKGFTDFYTRTMEAKLWYLRLKFDPERSYEIEGIYEMYSRDHAIVAFYVKKM